MDPTLQKKMEAALAHHSSGRLDEADAVYRSVDEAVPGHPDVLHLRGVVAYQQGRLDDALMLIGRAIEIHPREPDYHSNLGNVLKARGSMEKALASYQEALRIAPDFLDAHNNLGSVLKSLGRNDEAAAAFREVISRNPRSAQAYNNLGTVHRVEGRTEEAASAYLHALEIDPNYADAHFNLGNLRLQTDDPMEAADAFTRALATGSQAGPRAVETHLRLADALDRADRIDEAVAHCRQAIRLRPANADAHNDLGRLLQRSGQIGEALDAYKEARRLDPGHTHAAYNLATALQEQGHAEEARRGYAAVLENDPSYARAHRALGKLLYGLGDVAGATEVYRKWCALAPDDPEARHLLEACSGETLPERASEEFVRKHYNEFARDFDRQLGRLGYCGPELIRESLAPLLGDRGAELDVLDLGCGTGLSGIPVSAWSRRLVGVDIAEAILQRATERGIYDDLEAVELLSYLERHPNEFDLVVAADTFIYFGRLDTVFGSTARALRTGGLFAFTVEDLGTAETAAAGNRSVDTGYALLPAGRYAHSEPYLTETLSQAGFEVVEVRRAGLRTEVSKEVGALVVVARVS